MDSVTQALLGATTFALVQDKNIGKSALWIGAAAGTLPDLDVFLRSFYHEVEFVEVHRGFSHSIFFAVIMSLLLGRLFYRLYKNSHSENNWRWAFFLAIFTHPLLDVCTSYGTQLLNPLSRHLFSTHNIFVIEPSYTLILLIGFVVLLSINRNHRNRPKIIRFTLLLSCVFLLWTFISQAFAKNQFKSELARQNLAYNDLLVVPTPLNSLLWSGVAKTDSGFYFASYSLMDKISELNFSFEKSRFDLIPMLDTQRLAQIYLHYCDGYPLIKQNSANIIRVYAAKYGPVGFENKPKFLFPMVLDPKNMTSDAIYLEQNNDIKIEAETFSKLWDRVMGRI